MATVTKEIDGTNIVFTISSIYPQIAINSLFTFIRRNGNFRVSEDGGNNYGGWESLTENNLRVVVVDLENSDVVVQFSYSTEESFLAINDAGDLLDINDAGDNLRIS